MTPVTSMMHSCCIRQDPRTDDTKPAHKARQMIGGTFSGRI